jgi:DNA-binding MarR family transcriptional regulator
MRKTPQPRQALGQTLMLLARDFQKRLDGDLEIRGIPGIGARHRAVFLFLGRNGASRAVDLAEAADISPQSMMKIVHELESLGLVERREDPSDSRAKLIDFTDDGRQLITDLSRSTEIVWQQYARIIGKENLEKTIIHLNTVIDAKEEKRDE